MKLIEDLLTYKWVSAESPSKILNRGKACARIVQVESSLSIDHRGPWCVVSFWRSYGRSVGRSHAESFVTRSTYSGQRPTPQALPASPSLSLSLFLSLVRPTISLAPLITLPFYNAPLCSAAEPCIFLDAMDFPKAFRCSASLAPFLTCLCQSLRDKPRAELSFHRNNTESVTNRRPKSSGKLWVSGLYRIKKWNTAFLLLRSTISIVSCSHDLRAKVAPQSVPPHREQWKFLVSYVTSLSFVRTEVREPKRASRRTDDSIRLGGWKPIVWVRQRWESAGY